MRHLFNLTLLIALTIDFFEGFLGPLFLAGVRPKGSVLVEEDLPLRILASRLEASRPLDLAVLRFGEVDVFRRVGVDEGVRVLALRLFVRLTFLEVERGGLVLE